MDELLPNKRTIMLSDIQDGDGATESKEQLDDMEMAGNQPLEAVSRNRVETSQAAFFAPEMLMRHFGTMEGPHLAPETSNDLAQRQSLQDSDLIHLHPGSDFIQFEMAPPVVIEIWLHQAMPDLQPRDRRVVSTIARHYNHFDRVILWPYRPPDAWYLRCLKMQDRATVYSTLCRFGRILWKGTSQERLVAWQLIMQYSHKLFAAEKHWYTQFPEGADSSEFKKVADFQADLTTNYKDIGGIFYDLNKILRGDYRQTLTKLTGTILTCPQGQKAGEHRFPEVPETASSEHNVGRASTRAESSQQVQTGHGAASVEAMSCVKSSMNPIPMSGSQDHIDSQSQKLETQAGGFWHSETDIQWSNVKNIATHIHMSVDGFPVAQEKGLIPSLAPLQVIAPLADIHRQQRSYVETPFAVSTRSSVDVWSGHIRQPNDEVKEVNAPGFISQSPNTFRPEQEVDIKDRAHSVIDQQVRLIREARIRNSTPRAVQVDNLNLLEEFPKYKGRYRDFVTVVMKEMKKSTGIEQASQSQQQVEVTSSIQTLQKAPSLDISQSTRSQGNEQVEVSQPGPTSHTVATEILDAEMEDVDKLEPAESPTEPEQTSQSVCDRSVMTTKRTAVMTVLRQIQLAHAARSCTNICKDTIGVTVVNLCEQPIDESQHTVLRKIAAILHASNTPINMHNFPESVLVSVYEILEDWRDSVEFTGEALLYAEQVSGSALEEYVNAVPDYMWHEPATVTMENLENQSKGSTVSLGDKMVLK